MNALLTVTLLGLSAEGLVMCPFFAFGLSLADRHAALRFLSGRIVGLILFGAVMAAIGRFITIPEALVNIVFGVTLVGLGIYRIIKSRPQLEFLTKTKARGPLGLGCGNSVSRKIGFGLGVYRGLLNPGRKYAYLAPLVMRVGVMKSLALSCAFGLSSSVYLVVGFLSAGALETLVPHKRAIGLGLFYGYKGTHGLPA